MNIPFSPPDIREEEIREVTEALRLDYHRAEDERV